MGSPVVFAATRTKVLSSKGLLLKSGAIIDNDGRKNYITDGNFDNKLTSSWSLLHTTLLNKVPNQVSASWTAAAGALSKSLVTTNQLSGTHSLSVASSAATTAGDMLVSSAYTIDREDQGKVLTSSFYYAAAVNSTNNNFSGTSNNTWQVYIYDVFNNAWIQPSAVYGMNQGTGVGYVTCQWQTPSNMTSLRLAVVCCNASAGATTLYFDDFCTCPNQYVYGSPVTDWQSYVPTILATVAPSLGTGATQAGRWRRVGGDAEIEINIVAGATGSSAGTGTYYFSLPSIAIDPSKIAAPQIAAGISTPLGIGSKADSGGTAIVDFKVIADSVNNNGVILVDSTAAAVNSALNGVAASRRYTLTAKVPILGWSSNVQMSDSADTRVVAMKAVTTGVPTGSLSGASATIFGTIDFDTNALYNSTTGIYTVGIPGYYKVSGQVIVEGTEALNQFLTLGCYVNTTPTQLGLTRVQNTLLTSTFATVNTTVKCNAGDTISLRTNTNITSAAFANDGSAHWFTVERLSGPSAIAATETVAASYWLSANFTASTTIPINFDSKEFDSHSAVTTSATAWKFTAPISGTYLVTGIGGASTAVTSFFALYKTNSSLKLIGVSVSGSLNTYTTTIRLLAGDFIDLRPSSSQTMQGGTLQAGACSIQITRVGN